MSQDWALAVASGGDVARIRRVRWRHKKAPEIRGRQHSLLRSGCSTADPLGLVHRVTVVRSDSHLDVVAIRDYRSLRESREPLTAIPLVGAFDNAFARRIPMFTISDGRLNQQQRRCGEEQKVFHDILPASEDLELATDAA